MASAALATGACKASPDVQVLSETVRLERSRPSPKASTVFDGSVVRLRGVRGETLGLQVRISDDERRAVRLRLSARAARVSAFSVRSLAVSEPSTDMYGPSSGAGLYPDVLVPMLGPVTSNDVVYFDVAILPDAVPGRYEGTLALGDRVLPVVLDVDRARIDLAEEPLVWVFYTPGEIARASGLSDGDGPALLAKEAEYDALFRAHGAYLASDLPPARFVPRRHFVHDVSYWPVAIDLTSDASIRRDVRAWLALFDGSSVIPFTIPIDEPHTEAARERARHVAEVIGQAGGGRPRLLRGVTDAARDVYGTVMDVFISPTNIPAAAASRAQSGERFWTYNGRPPGAGSMILDTEGAALRTWGWIAVRYDVELWYAWEGVYYSDRYNGGHASDPFRDPITFDERRRGGTDFGNGDGVLVYPGPLASLRLKALRRGLQDRLLLRALSACKGAAMAEGIAREVVPLALGEAAGAPAWPTDDSAWAAARTRVLDALESRCP